MTERLMYTLTLPLSPPIEGEGIEEKRRVRREMRRGNLIKREPELTFLSSHCQSNSPVFPAYAIA